MSTFPGLVKVIDEAIGKGFAEAVQLNKNEPFDTLAWSTAIARAVVEFATTDEAMIRLENACPRGKGRDDVEPQALVRAALGEETTDVR